VIELVVRFDGKAHPYKERVRRSRRRKDSLSKPCHTVRVSPQQVLDLMLASVKLFPLDVTHSAIYRTAVEVPRLAEKNSNLRLVLSSIAAFFANSYKEAFAFSEGVCRWPCPMYV
jgi:hypothetical protein